VHVNSGKPKGCVSSLQSLQHYIRAKNIAHNIERGKSTVLLASAITFDPCFSDVLATFVANATLAIASRDRLYGHSDDGEDVMEHDNITKITYRGLTKLLCLLEVTHVLCTPTLWATVEGDPPENVPSLRVVALGGEPIPKSMRARWARCQLSTNNSKQSCCDREYPRLFATYGVTEACVYQTCGEVFQINDTAPAVGKSPGQSVGQPLLGSQVHICRPLSDDSQDKTSSFELLSNSGTDAVIGEVVLSGAQLDGLSSYLNLPTLTNQVFFELTSGSNNVDSFYYRTGDIGCIDTASNNLHVMGRIKGDGMVKINGVRIELAEIESALIDDSSDERKGGGLVIDCMANTTSNTIESTNKQLVAYCILSPICTHELSLNPEQLKNGIIVQEGPLLAVLRTRCDKRVRKGCTPAYFILIDRLPLSATGKRNRSGLPSLETCILMGYKDSGVDESLWNCGVGGPIVAEKVCECLNLPQRALVTTRSNFFSLGGDSLSA
jgi:acyl-CoA synthetase (AMP-forming)/AMP-acid ligase II